MVTPMRPMAAQRIDLLRSTRTHAEQFAKVTDCRWQRRRISQSAMGAEHQPTPRHFTFVPSGDDLGARAKDRMKVVGMDWKGKYVDPKSSGELVKVFVDPNFSVIKIPAGDGIIAHQQASFDGPIVDVSASNLI